MNERKHDFDTTQSYRSRNDIEWILVTAWWNLYNHDLPCGAKALVAHLLEEEPTFPMPSLRTIARMLAKNEVPNNGYYLMKKRRCGWY